MDGFKLYNYKFPKPIDKEESLELLKLAKAGNTSAINKLVNYNMRLIFSIVYSKFSSFNNKEDLVSEGILALYDAICEFDLSYSNTKFSTYAYYHILKRIYNYLNKENTHSNNVSINQLIEDNDIENYTCYFDGILIQSDKFIDDIEDEMMLKEVKKHLNNLNDTDINYLSYHFGLRDGIYHTYANTGKRFSVSRQYATNRICKAFKKIRLKVKNT